MLLVYTSFDYPCRTHQYGIWQSNDVYFVVIYYAIPAYYPELELQIVFLSGFNANHLYKAKSRKAWIIHRCLARFLCTYKCVISGNGHSRVSRRILPMMSIKSSSFSFRNSSMAVCRSAGFSSDSSKNWLGVISK